MLRDNCTKAMDDLLDQIETLHRVNAKAYRRMHVLASDLKEVHELIRDGKYIDAIELIEGELVDLGFYNEEDFDGE